MHSVKIEHQSRVADFKYKLTELEREVEKYKILAGIESLTHAWGQFSPDKESPEAPLPPKQMSVLSIFNYKIM